MAYIDEDNNHRVHGNESTNPPKQVSIDDRWRENSVVKREERCLDEGQRQRIHHLVGVPMFQVGDVRDFRLLGIAYSMGSEVDVSRFVRTEEI